MEDRMMKTIGIVQTAYGQVSGLELTGAYEGITQFRGIPFAGPPVGELRWRAPQSPASWQGVRECLSYGPVCIQPTNGDLDAEPWATDFYYMGAMPQSEDCLYLNVTTGAADQDEKRPVYVWFHGGGSDHGYSYEVEFDNRELAKKGIVVVTVAQRLHALGYLALPQLSAEQGGKSGNYILMDDVKALEWVVENIAAFGGDPDNITVGGQSAGTGKAVSLAFTPYGRKHIKRIINQSGLSWMRSNKTLPEYEKTCADFLTKLGIDPTLPMEELRKINATEFIPKFNAGRLPYGLVYDGDLVPDVSLVDSTAKYGIQFDYLAGSNLGEHMLKPGAKRGDKGFTSAEEFYAFARDDLGDLYDQFDFKNLFRVADETVDRETRRLASYGMAIGEKAPGGLMMNRYFGAWRTRTAPDKKTFNYLFCRIAPTRLEDRGTARDPDVLMSWHSNELWYTFASLKQGTPPARPWEEADLKLADLMSSYWANFIKTGDPNGASLPAWPASDAEHWGFMEFDHELCAHEGKDKLDDLIFAYLDQHKAWPEQTLI